MSNRRSKVLKMSRVEKKQTRDFDNPIEATAHVFNDGNLAKSSIFHLIETVTESLKQHY